MKLLKFFIGVVAFCILSACGSANSKIDNNPDSTKITGNLEDNLRYDSAGTFNQEDLNFLKETFRWTQDIIVINYNLEDKYCQVNYNRSSDPENRFNRARNYWDAFYSEVNLMGAKVVHVEASERYGKAFGTYSSQYYYDEKGFLLDHFLNNARECETVLVVNREGKYYQENFSYTKEQVAYYVAKLKAGLDKN